MLIVIGRSILVTWKYLPFVKNHEGTPLRLIDLLLCSGGEDVCDGPIHLSHLVSGAMVCLLPASQTMAAVCQMVASVSDFEMPTAIKNLLSENKSFNSGSIW